MHPHQRRNLTLQVAAHQRHRFLQRTIAREPVNRKIPKSRRQLCLRHHLQRGTFFSGILLNPGWFCHHEVKKYNRVQVGCRTFRLCTRGFLTYSPVLYIDARTNSRYTLYFPRNISLA